MAQSPMLTKKSLFIRGMTALGLLLAPAIFADDLPPPPPPPVAEDKAPPPPPPPVKQAEPLPSPVPPPQPRATPPVKPPEPVQAPDPARPVIPPTKPATRTAPLPCAPGMKCKVADDKDRDASRGAAAAAGAAATETPAPVKSRRFITGELANVGAIGLIPWENQFGIVAGIERVGSVYYAAVTPQINYSTRLADRPFSMSFGVPLRFELNDTRGATAEKPSGFSNLGRLRPEDHDELSDFAQIIRGIQYGGKEDHVYLDINAFKASSLGHGGLMRRYNPNLNLNSRQVSAELDAFGDYGGVETYINNIVRPSLIAGLAFVKPLSFVDRDNFVMRSFSIGLSSVADLDAPLRNQLDFIDADNNGRRELAYLVDQKTFHPQYIATKVIGVGMDTEIKLVDTKTTDWKMYADYSTLMSGLPTDTAHPTYDSFPSTRYVSSSGLTWGNLLRLNLGDDPVHALRLRAEVRRYDANYLPGYFDVMYEIQRLQYRLGSKIPDPNGTKLQQILGRDASGAKVLGMYFEASWKIEELFALSLAMEVNDSTPDNNFFVHIEMPQVKDIQFLATYHRRSAKSASDLFAAEFTTRDIFLLKGRYRVSDNFHINIEALTPFGIGPDSFFANTIDFNLNVEFGFPYGGKK